MRCGTIRLRFAKSPKRKYGTEKIPVAGACLEVPYHRVAYTNALHPVQPVLPGMDGSISYREMAEGCGIPPSWDQGYGYGKQRNKA